MTMFEKKTGNYSGRNPLDRLDDSLVPYRVEGKRYDGGKSPLGDAVVLMEPDGGVLDASEPFNHSQPGRWSDQVQAAYDALRRGRMDAGQTQINAWASAFLMEAEGVTLEAALRLSAGRRRKLCNRLVAAAREEMTRREEALLARIVSGTSVGGHGPSTVPGGRVERGAVMAAVEQQGRGGLPRDLTDRRASQQARNDLFRRLRQWALGPLVLERPQGSSLHHLIDYDLRQGSSPDTVIPGKLRDAQIVLVENDWGAAVPEMEGEWRVPFEFISWEFRISGVRVLAITEATPVNNSVDRCGRMWCVYGADGHWVADDYGYDLGRPALPAGVPIDQYTTQEFRRVARMCYDTIRASCIMLDARIAHNEHVAVSAKLRERRARDGRAPLRDHYVVRLLNSDRRAHVRARSAGSGISVDVRAPQRGHWRKATWVHYDDPDSGQVQYPNDGGFVVSKTWRRWHFAGDPRNIIHKEYRL